MNNLTKDNLDTKSVDIRDRVVPDFLAWFANYMVVKRAAQVRNRVMTGLTSRTLSGVQAGPADAVVRRAARGNDAVGA